MLRAKTGPAMICEPDDLLRVRFNMYDRGFAYLGSRTKDLQLLHEAMSAYQQLTLREENQWRIVLKPGTLVLFDNWRVLHARTAFEGRRTLNSLYVAEEEFSTALTKHGAIQN